MRTSLSEQEIPNRDLYYHEVKQLLDYYKDHTINYGLLTMLAMTGLRVQEIANASWGDVYLDSLSGHYRLRGVGKGGKNLISYFIHLYMNKSLPFEHDVMSLRH
ncbi:tyrosine-type recombinase/integrase [Priestia megaterium]|uniref:tyrosine-type recombinase/integrase n=1 Tax=Priestia megaterium TaxID=1404 RepID=UPI001C44C747|nr:tyrosine-type recombinase/integrase [Priestia megaterium]MBV6737665.1 tyrosine-type recombinase/integrase [Priestia megaterium]